MALSEQNPVYGPFFGVMGAAAAIIFSGIYQYWKKKMDVGIFNSLFVDFPPCSPASDPLGMSSKPNSNDLTLPQRSEPPTEQRNQAQVLQRCRSWDPSWLWNRSSLSLWRVSLPSTDLSWPSSSREPSSSPNSTLFTSEFAKNSFFHPSNIESCDHSEEKINDYASHSQVYGVKPPIQYEAHNYRCWLILMRFTMASSS